MSVIALLALGLLSLVVFGIFILLGGKSARDAARNIDNYAVYSSHGRVCPRCQAPLPTARMPTNMRQFLFGGWTCKRCGAELDKQGGLSS